MIHYDDDSIHVSIEIQQFDDYPRSQDLYVEIPSGNSFYESIVAIVKD